MSNLWPLNFYNVYSSILASFRCFCSLSSKISLTFLIFFYFSLSTRPLVYWAISNSLWSISSSIFSLLYTHLLLNLTNSSTNTSFLKQSLWTFSVHLFWQLRQFFWHRGDTPRDTMGKWQLCSSIYFLLESGFFLNSFINCFFIY